MLCRSPPCVEPFDCSKYELILSPFIPICQVGDINARVLAMLDDAHAQSFGEPEPTQVKMTATEGKAILVSGHDLIDLETLLKQTEGTGVNVYTHGEMLPAHGYPGLKKVRSYISVNAMITFDNSIAASSHIIHALFF